MVIRHKTQKDRKIENVVEDDRRTAYVSVGDGFHILYPYSLWEPADIEEWVLVAVTTERDQKSLRDGSTHVAGILNMGYRFPDGMQVEKRVF